MNENPIRTIAAKLTDVGRNRNHNEDRVGIHIPSAEILKTKGALYVVSDGMGGYQAGEVASELALKTIIESYYADPQPQIDACLRHALEKVNTVIHQSAQGNPQHQGMGTTAVVAVVCGSEVHVANVGDSRAYLLRGSQIQQITKDHSFVQEQIDANILTPEAARNHPQRNVITRALGHKPHVQVDTFKGELLPGDALLLCSDGLSGPVRDQEIAPIVDGYPPPDAVARLIKMANANGGPDNISAIVVRALKPEPGKPPAAMLAPSPQTATGLPAVAPLPPTLPARQTGDKPESAPAASGPGNIRWVAAGVLGVLFIVALISIAFLLLNGNDAAKPAAASSPAPADSTQPAPPPTGGVPPATSISPTITPQGSGPPDATVTPTLNPSTTPKPTNTPTPRPTFTPKSVCQPALPLQESPADGETFSPGQEVTFSWSGNHLCPGHKWRVQISGENYQGNCGEPTEKRQVSCLLPTKIGNYTWVVDTLDNQETIVQRASSYLREFTIKENQQQPTDPPTQPTDPPQQPTGSPPPVITPPQCSEDPPICPSGQKPVCINGQWQCPGPGE